MKRSKPRLGKAPVEEGSDNSSLCANSDLSNISDESLPSDMEDVEVDDEEGACVCVCVCGVHAYLWQSGFVWSVCVGGRCVCVGGGCTHTCGSVCVCLCLCVRARARGRG